MKPVQFFSIRQLMLAVVVVAVDFAIARGWSSTGYDPGIAYSTLPMVSLLILVAPRALRAHAGRRFWIGFEVAGWSLAGLFAYLAYRHGPAFFRLANSLYPWDTIRDRSMQTAFLILLDFGVYTPPLILAAWIVGRLSARYRTAHQRRDRSEG